MSGESGLKLVWDIIAGAGALDKLKATVAVAMVAGGVWLGGTFDPVPAPEEQPARDDLHRMSFVFKDRAGRCESTWKERALFGYQASNGAQKALDLIESAYPDPKERAVLEKFLEESNVTLHATDEIISRGRAVLHNTSPDNRVLLVNAFPFITSYTEGFRMLMEDIQKPGALNEKGTFILFWNAFEKEKEFLDTRFVQGTEMPKSFNVVLDVSTTKVEIDRTIWENPCPPVPSASQEKPQPRI